MSGPAPPVRIVRVIARLNIGGPAIQAITLTRELRSRGYDTVLVRGVEGAGEGNMDALAAAHGVHPVRVASMSRDPGPGDLRALGALARLMRRERPAVVHTHAAKGGTLGRVAALLAFPLPGRRPVIVHTYHGHSLTGYFSARTSEVYRRIEQLLGRCSDALIAVSSEVRDELVALGVAPASKFVVVPLGFDLSPFACGAAESARRRHAARRAWGITDDAPVVLTVARLVPIKRVDRFLRIARAVQAQEPGTRFVVVGDGELRAALAASAVAAALGDAVVWAGFRADMPDVYPAADVVVQTSDNEGTPVSLIEALASGVPVVSTRVGGTATVVGDDRWLVAPEDEVRFAAAVITLLRDGSLRRDVGDGGQARALARFSLGRLVDDIDRLYEILTGP